MSHYLVKIVEDLSTFLNSDWLPPKIVTNVAARSCYTHNGLLREAGHKKSRVTRFILFSNIIEIFTFVIISVARVWFYRWYFHCLIFAQVYYFSKVA